MITSVDVLVIGAGLQGLLSARELHLAGVKVALLERHQPGQEASWAAGGILSPLYPWRYLPSILALSSWSQQHYPGLIAELGATTGIDAQWLKSGLLILEPEEVAAAMEWAESRKYPVQRVLEPEIRALEPALAQVPEAGLWLPEVAQMRNPRLLKALGQELVQSGVPLLTDTQVRGLRIDKGRCLGVDTNNGSLSCESVVLCAGAWTPGLWPGIDAPKIWPVKGQMILLAGPPGLLKTISMRQARYFVPRADGQVLVGSSLEETDFDCQTTERVRDELLRVARERVPALADARVEHQWAGLRPATEHGVPYIGAHPEIQGLFVNAGHYRNGLVLAPASARLLTDLLLKRPPILDPEPYGFEAVH